MFRALSMLNTQKEGYVDHPQFAVDQTRRFTKQYPNSYLTSQTDPALLPNTVMGLATWNPTTRQPTQRDLDLSQQAISLDVGSELQNKNNVCKSSSIDDLMNSQDPNARLRCGWVYKKGDPGTRPRVSQGVLATRNGPVPMFDAPDGTFYWDLYDAQKAIVKDRCLSMTSCGQVGTPEYQNCAYSKTRGTGIPVMGNGTVWYPNDPVLSASPNSLVYNSSGCPAPPPPNSPQAELARSRDVCAPLPDGRLGRDCMLQQITAAGCSTDGTLYKQLLNSATPNNYSAGLTNELSFKKYQQLATKPINDKAVRDGSVSVDIALGTFLDLNKVAKQDGTTAINFAARDLCIQRGIMDSFDFCSELVDGSPPPFALDCLQKEFRRQGGQPAGTDYPSAQTLGLYNGMRNWGAVRTYISNLAAKAKTEGFHGGSTTEGFVSGTFPPAVVQQVQNMVNNGKLLNYDSCVTNPESVALAGANKFAGDDGGMNATRYTLCKDYYKNGFWRGGIDPNIDDRKGGESAQSGEEQRNALKRFYGITETQAPSLPQIARINGSEYMWFNRGNNTFIGRRLNVQNPDAPVFDNADGIVQQTNLAETVSYIYLANLRPPTKQRVRLKYITDDGMLFTLNRDINPDMYTNLRVDTDSIFGVNWLQPPTQHIQNSCWTLQPNGANYVLGFWYENFGYATSQLQYAPCDGGAFQNVPSNWITLTIEPDAPMVSFELIKKAGATSFQEYRIPNVFPLMINPKVSIGANGLQLKTGLGALSAYTGVNFSPNSWRSMSCSFTVGSGNFDPQNPAYCGSAGRQSADGAIRLYNRGECDTLGGIFHGNGECTKPQGGSFSWDCRNAGRVFNLPMVGLGDWFWFGLNGSSMYIGGYINYGYKQGPLQNVLKPDGQTKHYAVAVMKSEYGNSYPNRITFAVGTEEDWRSGRASLTSPTNAIVIRTNGNNPIFNPSDSHQLTFGSSDATVSWCRFFDYEMTDKDVVRDINNTWARAFF